MAKTGSSREKKAGNGGDNGERPRTSEIETASVPTDDQTTARASSSISVGVSGIGADDGGHATEVDDGGHRRAPVDVGVRQSQWGQRAHKSVDWILGVV
ncbi:hypothetical protein RHMOL_Rhmol06G0110700 [Rhododendron molle]|uniref:Uncharacterized protein n=1 Tax=Rhododendron molle TaxID=49168 RepID=A0ACC0NCN7_RHOML|nr:hypothetical protein RHMOL_Rhmol06G0110700 [Rhododendron molle]